MPHIRVLVAEDDPASSALLTKYLTAKGYVVSQAFNGSEVLTKMVAHTPHVILLDVEMPERNGWEALEEIRTMSSVPVIMVTVRSDTADKVRGLEAGADDYVTKPFDLKEIEARIRAVLRRGQNETAHDGPTSVTIGSLIIDDEAKNVSLDDHPLALSPKEYDLLLLLCQQAGKVYATEEIIAGVWPERDDATAEDVKKYIYFLRNKMNDVPSGNTGDRPIIETVRGFGYKIVTQP